MFLGKEPHQRWFLRVLFAFAIVGFLQPTSISAGPAGFRIHLPLIMGESNCRPIPGETYHTLSVEGSPTDRPAEEHADLNLALRGYVPVNEAKTLIDYAGGADPDAPQLAGLFAYPRAPTFSSVYQVYDWDWSCNCRGGPISTFPVTLAGLAAEAGETVHVPDAGTDIGKGYVALVLYASERRLTLKYTREDNVVEGYTIHIEEVCVEPRLLALYRACNDSGRETLPALRGGQAIGRARGGDVRVAIRDTGSFMDPRSRKDWWHDF